MPLRIAPGIEIPDDELELTASRSGGPGGQHVNKTSSKITIRFVIATSPSLPPRIRERLVGKLARRLDAEGAIRVTAQDSRSQHVNRKAATARLEALLARASVPDVPRVATRVSKTQKIKRRDEKQQRGVTKSRRGRVRDDEA